MYGIRTITRVVPAMLCTQCGLSNPPDISICTKCSTPLPLDDRTIEDSSRDSDSSPDADQTLMHGWSEPSAPHRTVSAERFRPGRMLGNRYQILQLLGEGGAAIGARGNEPAGCAETSSSAFLRRRARAGGAVLH